MAEGDTTSLRRTRTLLAHIVEGRSASTDLLPHVYVQLRQLAGTLLDHRDEVTLQPTALVHEAFLQLGARRDWEGRAHFLAIAAKAMRDILIDHVRSRGAQKRGGGWARVTLQGVPSERDKAGEDLDLLVLHEALNRLAELDARQAEIVEMRYFGGMTGEEIGHALGVSRNTVVRELKTARAWLLRELSN